MQSFKTLIMHYKPVQILWFVFTFLLLGCRGEQTGVENSKTEISQLSMDVLLEIGLPSQPVEHQLGEPVAVRTDELGNIYIADRSSQKFKVFDESGNYIREFGGRGRGPGEFQAFYTIEYKGDDEFFVLDWGAREFEYVTNLGEFITSEPVDMTSQLTTYFPEKVVWFEEYTFGLDLEQADAHFDPPPKQRHLFNIYGADLKEKIHSFFPFSRLGFKDESRFVWGSFIYLPGSISTSNNMESFIYSPLIYRGEIYEFQRMDSLHWEISDTLRGIAPSVETYEIYESTEEYEENRDYPGVNVIYYDGDANVGRIYTMDMGVYHLNDDRVVHFFGEWREGDTVLEDGNPLILNAQLFDRNGKVLAKSELYNIHKDLTPIRTLVNWKDDQDNFYLLNVPKDDVPTVIKFRLELEELADSGQ
jgi:hypothetical protein